MTRCSPTRGPGSTPSAGESVPISPRGARRVPRSLGMVRNAIAGCRRWVRRCDRSRHPRDPRTACRVADVARTARHSRARGAALPVFDRVHHPRLADRDHRGRASAPATRLLALANAALAVTAAPLAAGLVLELAARAARRPGARSLASEPLAAAALRLARPGARAPPRRSPACRRPLPLASCSSSNAGRRPRRHRRRNPVITRRNYREPFGRTPVSLPIFTAWHKFSTMH